MNHFFKLFFIVCVWQAHAAFNLTWGVPGVDLDEAPAVGDSDLNATVALDPHGNAIALWSRTNGGKAGEDVWVATYSHSSRKWKDAIRVSGGGNALNGSVAFDSIGNAMIVWEEGFPTHIVARTLSAKGVWTPPLGSPPDMVCKSPYSQTLPRIVMDPAGDALLIWMEFYGSLYHIHSAKRLFGQSWTNLGRISNLTNNAHLHFTTPLSINEKGDAVAVWQETNSQTGYSEIHGARFTNGRWLSPTIIAAEPAQQSLFPSVGIDAQGNAVVVWNQFGATFNTIQSKTWIGDQLSQTLLASNPTFISQRPHVAVDAQGNAVVVYERYDMGPTGLASMNKFIAGATLPFNANSWSNLCDISGPSQNPTVIAQAGYPVVSLNAIGDGVVVWKEYNGNNTIVQAAGYSLGTWSLFRTLSATHQNAGAPFGAYDLGVGINLAGNILAVWPEDWNGTNSQHIRAISGVGFAAEAPLPPISIPQVPDSQIVVTPVTLPPITVPVTHPTAPLPELVSMASSTPSSGSKPTSGSGNASAIVALPGKQVLHRFPGHGDLINILSWSAPGGKVASYKVYRGNLSSLIGITQKTQFEDHQRVPGQVVTYLITSVDSNGQESAPITIIVSPM